jgi:hypothetical protein
MGDDMYEYGKQYCSSSAPAPAPAPAHQPRLPSSSSTSDEISLFVHQILLGSSSSSSSSSLMGHTGERAQLYNSKVFPGNPDLSCRSALVQDGISGLESSSGVSTTGSGVFLSNVSTSSLGASENETDEYDCESEVIVLLIKVWTFLFVWLLRKCGKKVNKFLCVVL